MELPLKGIRVIELANVLAGPSAGMFMAELGADVIKVENVLTCGDATRRWKLPGEDPENDISSYFSSVNWGKKSLAVDITTREGLSIVHNLARYSDIILASYKPGDAEKLKVDYNTFKNLNRDIIYAHVTGYGTKNPRAGYDAVIQAESGFTYINGEPGGDPVKMPVALMDVLASHQLKEAILLALLSRERGGGGAYLETSLIKSGIASLVNQASNWLVGRTIPQRMGSDHPNIVPYGTIFKTRDNHQIVIAAGTDRQFAKLCELLKIEHIAKDNKFETNQNRVINSSELKDILQKAFLNYNRDELLTVLQENKVPAGGILNMQEVFETEYAKEMLINGESDTHKLTGVRSVAFSTAGDSLNRPLLPPPGYGEHTSEILNRLLGFTSTEIEELITKKVLYGNRSAEKKSN